MSHEAVKLLKTQDQGYLRVVMARNRKEMGRVREELGGGGQGEGRKVVFEEGPEVEMRGKKRGSDGEVLGAVVVSEELGLPEVEDYDMDGEQEDGESQLVKPKSKKSLLADKDAAARLRTERKKRRRLQDVRATKLEMLKRRQKEIMAAADQIELQRAKMAKTIGGVNKNGVKFKIRERKK